MLSRVQDREGRGKITLKMKIWILNLKQGTCSEHNLEIKRLKANIIFQTRLISIVSTPIKIVVVVVAIFVQKR